MGTLVENSIIIRKRLKYDRKREIGLQTHYTYSQLEVVLIFIGV